MDGQLLGPADGEGAVGPLDRDGLVVRGGRGEVGGGQPHRVGPGLGAGGPRGLAGGQLDGDVGGRVGGEALDGLLGAVVGVGGAVAGGVDGQLLGPADGEGAGRVCDLIVGGDVSTACVDDLSFARERAIVRASSGPLRGIRQPGDALALGDCRPGNPGELYLGAGIGLACGFANVFNRHLVDGETSLAHARGDLVFVCIATGNGDVASHGSPVRADISTRGRISRHAQGQTIGQRRYNGAVQRIGSGVSGNRLLFAIVRFAVDCSRDRDRELGLLAPLRCQHICGQVVYADALACGDRISVIAPSREVIAFGHLEAQLFGRCGYERSCRMPRLSAAVVVLNIGDGFFAGVCKPSLCGVVRAIGQRRRLGGAAPNRIQRCDARASIRQVRHRDRVTRLVLGACAIRRRAPPQEHLAYRRGQILAGGDASLHRKIVRRLVGNCARSTVSRIIHQVLVRGNPIRIELDRIVDLRVEVEHDEAAVFAGGPASPLGIGGHRDNAQAVITLRHNITAAVFDRGHLRGINLRAVCHVEAHRVAAGYRHRQMRGSGLVGRGPFRVQRKAGRRHGLGSEVKLLRQGVVFVPSLELVGRIEPLGTRRHIAFKAAQRLLVLDLLFLAGGVVVVERQRVGVARMTNQDIVAIHVGCDGLTEFALLPSAPAILAVFGKRETDIPFALVESPPRLPRVRDVVVRNARPRPVKVLRIELI